MRMEWPSVERFQRKQPVRSRLLLPSVKSDSTIRNLIIFKSWRAAALSLVLTLGLLGSVYSGLNLYSSVNPDDFNSRQSSFAEAESISHTAAYSLPTAAPSSLRIPKVGIDAGFVPLGLNADQTIQTPTVYDKAGWYKYGPSPGEIGPAVVVGHVDSPTSPAIFWRLDELGLGDIIEVERSDKTVARFKVTKIKQVPRNNFPNQEVYGSINYAGVRLITCAGQFDRKVHRYTHNLVVYGSMINSSSKDTPPLHLEDLPYHPKPSLISISKRE